MAHLIARVMRLGPAIPQSVPRAEVCRSVLMVGADPEGAGGGGIRAVVQGYRQGGLFERVPCTYVATHRSGPAWVKLLAAVKGWAQVAHALRTLDAPLVHVHMASRASFWRKSVVCLLARLARRPYLLHVHGAEFHEFYARECSALARRIVRGTLAKAALVIALSDEWQDRLAGICPGARIEVLSNAVPPPRNTGHCPAGHRQPTVLFLGEVSRRKGVYDLTRAFARVAPRCPRAKLVYGGTGALEKIRELAAQLQLGGRVECTGWLEPERKGAQLAAATIFALPSYAEGMPMALLEAMGVGLPVITTPVGGIPQVILHEVNGLLVAPGDIDALSAAIHRLLRDPPLRQRLGEAARATVATRFSLESMIEQLVCLYRRFGIEARPARAPEPGCPPRRRVAYDA